MREIKFRGKSYETGKWIIGNVTLYYDEIIALIEENLKDMQEVDWETVGQYTTLKDSVDYEVFEGDIIEDFINHKRNEVIWDDYGMF